MKKIILLVILSIGCQRSSNQTWENMKTAGCYFKKGFSSLIGQNTEFDAIEDAALFLGPKEEGYIPLNEQDIASLDERVPQSRLIPGKGEIPHISNFQMPKDQLASIFQKLYFDTDDHVIRDAQELAHLQKIASFMKKNPKMLLSIEGHCDERASAGYNMALGARRANHVRVLLIKQGIDFNRLYATSYGKEKPVALGHSEKDWKKNRRVEFKIYER